MSLDTWFGGRGMRLKDTPFYDVAAELYYRAAFTQYRIRDIVTGRYHGDPFNYDGFYRIAPAVKAVPPFWYRLHVGKRHRRDRVMGRHEAEVMETVVEYLDENAIFWEVGAYRGYFSLALASVVERVVAFEARDYAVENLEKAAVKNGYDNLTTVNATLGVDNPINAYLDEAGVPDVILMDIEGWEYDVIQRASKLLDEKPTMVIELHAESGWKKGQVINPEGEVEAVDSPSTVSPEGVQELLREHGYEVSEIHRRRDSNWHVLATPQ